jgi:hypothetical protein
MSGKKKNPIIFLFMLGLGIFGVIFALLIMPSGDVAARRVRFEPVIPQPPESPRVVVGSGICYDGIENNVAVETASGLIYTNCKEGWKVFKSAYGGPAPLEACQFDDPLRYSPDFDTLYFPVEDCGMYYKKGATVKETVYVVQTDHTLWRWDFEYGRANTIFYVTVGLLLGAFMGWIIGLLVKGIVSGE